MPGEVPCMVGGLYLECHVVGVAALINGGLAAKEGGSTVGVM